VAKIRSVTGIASRSLDTVSSYHGSSILAGPFRKGPLINALKRDQLHALVNDNNKYKQEVPGRTNRLLPFYTIWTTQKVMRPTILLCSV
jgi:hypothetical protein